MHSFNKCWGIEILESLQNVSLSMKGMYDEYIASVPSNEYEHTFGYPLARAPSFEVVLGDIFGHDWHDADLLFVNSTCFTNLMMDQIYMKSARCKKGSWFITLSKRLPYADLE